MRVDGAYVTCSIGDSTHWRIGMTVSIRNGAKEAARGQVISYRPGYVDLEITEDFGREKAIVGSLIRVAN